MATNPMPEVSRLHAALAGLVAAAAALAAGELPSAFSGESVSLVSSVANEFIDRYAASLKTIAVELFGTNDKPALVIGIIVVSLALGAGLGVAARRRLWIGVGGIGVFGLVGLFAASTDPQANASTAVLGAVLAVTAGTVSLRFLLKVAVGPWRTPRAGTVPNQDPTRRTPDRRAFLSWTGGIGAAAAVAGSMGRSVRAANQLEVDTASIAIPESVSTVSVPTATGVDVDGISPYVTPNPNFYRIDTAISVPRVDPKTWSLQVKGLVDKPFSITYDELLAMDLVEAPVTIECVSNETGGQLVGTAVWKGVPLAALLDRAGLQPEGTQIVGRSVDDFTIGMPTSVALDGREAMVALTMNGEPLPQNHGFPARLIVSGLYGYVSATKWLSEIELVRWEDFDAYWVPRGWSKLGPVKIDSRIDVPRRGDSLASGLVPIAGVAWLPNVGIESVEVRIDEGDWNTATLGKVASDDTWVQWVWNWAAPSGNHVIEVRAIGADGTVQTREIRGVQPDGATGYHQRRVSVS